MIARKLALAATLALAAGVASAVDRPYDESADAKAQIHAALVQAATTRKPVLLIFGANWCDDCQALADSMKTPRNLALMGKAFEVVKVDVGNFDHNMDISTAYGDATKKGIPAAVIVSPDNRVLYATRAGELAEARQMGDDGIYAFFVKAAGESGARLP